MPDLREPEREAASFCTFFTFRNGAKQHAGSRGHGMLRIISGPGCRLQRPGKLLREKALLDVLQQWSSLK
jgi:hypothetical protein